MFFLRFMFSKINFEGKGNAFLAFYVFPGQLFESTGGNVSGVECFTHATAPYQHVCFTVLILCARSVPLYVHFTLVPSSRPSQQQPTDHCFLPSAATVLCAHALRPGLHTVR